MDLHVLGSAMILWSFDYGLENPARPAFILGFLLLVPIAITFWFHRRALNVPDDSKPTVVFAYRRFITLALWGGALIWWIAIDVLHVDVLVQSLLPQRYIHGALAWFLPWLLLWMPPAIVYFVCLAFSPVHLLRGTTRTQAEALNQSFWSVARLVLPTALVIAAILELDSAPRLAVALFMAWIVTSRWTARKAADSHGMNLNALTSGDLRDRAFAIAKKARAKLNQIYVLPAERTRLANAFAHAASNIYLTDYLLKNLSTREVDAIIGHEVTHLQKNHVRTRMLLWVAVSLGVGFAVGWPQQWLPANIPAGPVLYGLFLLVLFFVSRRNEFAADAGAFNLTGDAAALITGLARVSRLNTMPIEWGKFDEKIITHPSTLRRMKHLAQMGGMSEASVPELLNQSLLPPTDTYPVPPTVQPSGKIFSTRFKTNLSWVLAWSLTTAAAVVPAAFAFVARQAHFSGSPLFIILILGFVFTCASCFGLVTFLPFWGTAKIQKCLREKLEKEGATVEVRNGLFVSLAPDPSPRVYEGNWSWDVGFLAVSDECLYYWGEETRFSLPREQVISVELGPGPVNWFKTPSIYISWRDSAGIEHVFNLRALQSASMFQMAAQTHRLAVALEDWHRRVSQAAGSILATKAKHLPLAETLGLPAFGEVTSASPRMIVRKNYLTRFFFLDGLVAAGVAILFGFQFPFLDPIPTGPGPVDLSSSGLAFLYILGTVWIVRVIQLWPYWRFREVTSDRVPASLPQ
ncbi:MAG: M48 family metalloprotease, partial [Candidatus Acidiferrales bacterium]